MGSQQWYEEYCKFCRWTPGQISETDIKVFKFTAGYQDDSFIIVADGTPIRATMVIVGGGASVDKPDMYVCDRAKQGRLKTHFRSDSKASEKVLRDLTICLIEEKAGLRL